MIPAWLLTILHCVALASAVAVLGLLIWHYWTAASRE